MDGILWGAVSCSAPQAGTPSGEGGHGGASPSRTLQTASSRVQPCLSWVCASFSSSVEGVTQ